LPILASSGVIPPRKRWAVDPLLQPLTNPPLRASFIFFSGFSQLIVRPYQKISFPRSSDLILLFFWRFSFHPQPPFVFFFFFFFFQPSVSTFLQVPRGRNVFPFDHSARSRVPELGFLLPPFSICDQADLSVPPFTVFSPRFNSLSSRETFFLIPPLFFLSFSY